MSHLFGRTFTRTFYPEENGQPFQLPSQAPAIYIFADEPTRAEAAAGTDALSSTVYWDIATTTPYGCTYSVTAINDPAPTSTTLTQDERRFWEAINCVTEASGQTQTTIRAFDMERPEGAPELPLETAAAVKAAYPAIANFLTDAQITNFAPLAKTELKIDLENRGYIWARIHNLGLANLACAYKAIALCALSKMKRDGDKYNLRYAEFSKKYDDMIGGRTFEFDRDQDGKPEIEEKQAHSYLFVSR